MTETTSPERPARGVGALTGGVSSIISLAIGLLALAWVLSRINLGETLDGLRGANYVWFGLGFATFYLSLPLRAWRWRMMLQNLGMNAPLAALSATIFRAWTVNCIVPGRAGDMYGAFMLRDEHGLSVAGTSGSILGARVLDFLTLMVLLTTVFWLGFSTSSGVSRAATLQIGWGFAAVVLIGLVVLRRSGSWVGRRLPPTFSGAWATFRHATFQSMRRVPLLVLLTVVLWLLEAFRLWCVLGAVGAPRPFLPVALLACVAALVTTLPVAPGGLGTVEALYQGFLPSLGISTSAAMSAAVLDRTINYWFILIAGSVYFLSQRRRRGRPDH